MNTQKSPIQINTFMAVIGGIEKRSVDARELHTQIQNLTPFSMWIKRKMEDINFIENKDFLTKLLKNDEKGRPNK